VWLIPVPVAATFTFQFIQPSNTFSLFFYQDSTHAHFICTGHGAGFVTPVARVGMAATFNVSVGA